MLKTSLSTPHCSIARCAASYAAPHVYLGRHDGSISVCEIECDLPHLVFLDPAAEQGAGVFEERFDDGAVAVAVVALLEADA